MASGSKKKTTMAKLARESRLRERRQEKQARKAARKLESTADPELEVPGDALLADPDESELVAAADEPAPHTAPHESAPAEPEPSA